jgi:hypothetical protein
LIERGRRPDHGNGFQAQPRGDAGDGPLQFRPRPLGPRIADTDPQDARTVSGHAGGNGRPFGSEPDHVFS